MEDEEVEKKRWKEVSVFPSVAVFHLQDESNEKIMMKIYIKDII